MASAPATQAKLVADAKTEEQKKQVDIERAFLERFSLDQVLGEGTYGKVKLGIERSSGKHFAVKVLDMKRVGIADVKKEVSIHRTMQHPNIVKLMSFFAWTDRAYIVMQLCEGGELFDRIEPDVGLNREVAHFYFRQLISAVEYVHSMNCAHRDIKPENLLLDEFGNLKLTDFGLATLYAAGGRSRVLTRRCGTPPYISPEVLNSSYAGLSADLWSSAVVLVTMISGSLPWERASQECAEYAAWLQRKHDVWPWSKIIRDSLNEFALLKKMLHPDQASRPSIQEIQADAWFRSETKLTRKIGPSGLVTEVVSQLSVQPHDVDIHSQVDPSSKRFRGLPAADDPLTQPMAMQDLRELNQFPQVVSASAPQMSVLPGAIFPTAAEVDTCVAGVPRIKRVSVIVSELPIKETLECLCQVLDKLGFRGRWRLNMQTATILVETVDLQREVLKFSARGWAIEDLVHVEFRRVKGDGLAFKRCYKAIRRELRYLAPPGSEINASQDEFADSQMSLFSQGQSDYFSASTVSKPSNA